MTLVGVLLINAAADPEPARPLLSDSLRRNHRRHRRPPLQADVLVVENEQEVP